MRLSRQSHLHLKDGGSCVLLLDDLQRVVVWNIGIGGVQDEIELEYALLRVVVDALSVECGQVVGSPESVNGADGVLLCR